MLIFCLHLWYICVFCVCAFERVSRGTDFLSLWMSLNRNKSSLSSGFQTCMWCRLRPIKHSNASGLFQHHPSISLSLLKTKSSRITHTSQMVSKHSRKLDVISHSLVRCLWCMVDVVCFFYTSISLAFWADHHMVWQSVTHFSLFTLKSNQEQFKETVQPQMQIRSSFTHPHVVLNLQNTRRDV